MEDLATHIEELRSIRSYMGRSVYCGSIVCKLKASGLPDQEIVDTLWQLHDMLHFEKDMNGLPFAAYRIKELIQSNFSGYVRSAVQN